MGKATFSRITCLALAAMLLLGACGVESPDGDALSHRFGKDYFGAGGVLSLTEPVAGDALITGGQISTAAEIEGDLVLAGGELSIGGRIGDDVYAAGGEVQLDAIVDGNVRLAGGDVAVGTATVIAGDTSLTGGRVSFDGDAKGYLQASGGKVKLGGSVQGDAEVRAEELQVAPGTRIGGKLIYYGPDKPVLPADAVVAGGVEFHESTMHRNWDSARDEVRSAAHWAGRVLLFLGVFAAAALFTIVFPGFSARAAERIARDPLKCGALGFAILVCAPVLVVLLLITVIGIPLALLLMPIYALLLLLGWVTAAVFVGRRGLQLLGSAQAPSPLMQFAALLAALVLLWLLRQVPVVGGLVAFVALLVGIGALVQSIWSHRDVAAAPGPR